MAIDRRLKLYKVLIQHFEDFTGKYPMTGLSTIFKKILDAGINSIPNDKEALNMLDFILFNGDYASVIQNLLNLRFSELPSAVKPQYKYKNGIKVAFWTKAGKVYDKVFSLLNLDGEKRGYFSDEEGNKVELIKL